MSQPRVRSAKWWVLVRKARAVCPSCGRKGLGYAAHPHAFGYKDHSRLSCRYCHEFFKAPHEKLSWP